MLRKSKHILSLQQIFVENRALWRQVEKYGTAGRATDDTIRRMRFAYWINKATDTHSDYVIITAFPQQQWLRESAIILLSYLYCLSC